MSHDQEPLIEVEFDGSRITLLGTAHVSRASADKVRELLATGAYDSVAVELCPSRYSAIVDPDALAKMDLFKVMREGKVLMVVASLALGAYQQRLAEQFGIEPGQEMREAIKAAQEGCRPVLLIDREIGVTLKRVAHNVSWWKRLGLMAGLMGSILSREEVDEKEIERLKEGDVLESTFAQFADQQRDLYDPLIDERDRYMAARLREEIQREGHKDVLAVVGAGHVRGISGYLGDSREQPGQTIGRLDQDADRQSLAQTHSLVDRRPRIPGFCHRFSPQPPTGLAAGYGLGADQRNPVRPWRVDRRGPSPDRDCRVRSRPDHIP